MRCRDIVENSPHISVWCKETFNKNYQAPFSSKKLYTCLCEALDGDVGCAAFVDDVCTNPLSPMSLVRAAKRIRKNPFIYKEQNTTKNENVELIKTEEQKKEPEEMLETPTGNTTFEEFIEMFVEGVREDAKKLQDSVKLFKEQTALLKTYLNILTDPPQKKEFGRSLFPREDNHPRYSAFIRELVKRR